jgi:hypothetical protein
MSGAEFLKRVLATVDDLALLYANTPPEAAERSLAEFGERVREGWRTALPWLPPHDLDGVIGDLVARVRARRLEIEHTGAAGWHDTTRKGCDAATGCRRRFRFDYRLSARIP